MTLSYDPVTDILKVEGMSFSMDVFRTWQIPTDRIFKFTRDGEKVILQQVFPCEQCKSSFTI